MSEDARAKGSAVRGGAGNLREILSTWDARSGKEGSMLAPLSQLQLDSITDLALAVEDRPLPDLVCVCVRVCVVRARVVYVCICRRCGVQRGQHCVL
jgi:hypothetical protein